MEVHENKQLSEEGIKQLQEGILLVFSKWWALQMAIQNQWGGPHSRSKSHDLASHVFDFFNQTHRKEPLYIDDLEELLDEGMVSFNTCADDGSVEQVAEQLMIMHEECLEGNYQSIQKLREVKAAPILHVESDSDEEETEDQGNGSASSMMVDSPKSLSNADPTNIAKNESRPERMAEAEDGWIEVSSRKGRGRKK